MACIIFGAGSYYGMERRPEPGDYIIAADGGWRRLTGATGRVARVLQVTGLAEVLHRGLDTADPTAPAAS